MRSMGGTGLEPVTPSLSIRGGRSLRFGEVRSEGMAERNPSVERTLERTRTNVERCHCCHAVRMFRRQKARPPETTPSNGEGDTGGAAARSCQRRRSGDQRTSSAEHGLLGMKRARIVAAVLLFGSMCALAIWLYDYRVWVVPATASHTPSTATVGSATSKPAGSSIRRGGVPTLPLPAS